MEALLVECLWLVRLGESPTAELRRRVQMLWRVVRCRRERIVVERRLWPRGGFLAEKINWGSGGRPWV